jgi:integrase
LPRSGAPQTLQGFGIELNPIANVGALSRFNRARKRVLSDDELACYLRRLEGVRDYVQDALIVALYLGGQRPHQLLRLQWVDVDLGAQLATLRDPGRREKPRVHLLSLTPVPLGVLKCRSALAAYDSRVFATLGGVQDHHYDMYEYMDEKRAALELWAADLEKLRQRPAPSTETEAQPRAPGGGRQGGRR